MTLTTLQHHLYMFVYSLSTCLACKFQNSRDFCLFCSLVYPQSLGTICLVHSRHSKFWWTNMWGNETPNIIPIMPWNIVCFPKFYFVFCNIFFTDLILKLNNCFFNEVPSWIFKKDTALHLFHAKQVLLFLLFYVAVVLFTVVKY